MNDKTNKTATRTEKKRIRSIPLCLEIDGSKKKHKDFGTFVSKSTVHRIIILMTTVN